MFTVKFSDSGGKHSASSNCCCRVVVFVGVFGDVGGVVELGTAFGYLLGSRFVSHFRILIDALVWCTDVLSKRGVNIGPVPTCD